MPVTFHRAGPPDADRVLDLMRAYYAFDGLALDEARARDALGPLLRDDTHGGVWLIRHGDDLAGYVVLALGYSLEYHGRDAFLDELYVHEAFRGQGIGTAALALVEATCRDWGVNALHLEVERANHRARDLYRARGFVDHDRYLMTRWITPPETPVSQTGP